MKADLSPVVKFNQWYFAPLDVLEEMHNGDGAFAALMIALPLYERLICAKLKKQGVKADRPAIKAAMCADLKLSEKEFQIFWDIFRNGFCHQGAGKIGDTSWEVSHEYPELPTFHKNENGYYLIVFDPWKFIARIKQQYLNDPELMDLSESFPLPDIFFKPK